MLGYTVTRSVVVPFTHDESMSYNHLIKDSVWQIINNNTSLISANNHILNTLLMQLFMSMFGTAVWVFRIQSLIAHVVYLFITYRVVRRIDNKIVAFAGYLLLNANPYLLDFFALARGYSLAIALMMFSFHFLCRMIIEKNDRASVYAMIAAFFSVTANFALLTYTMFAAAAIFSYYVYYYFTARHSLFWLVKKSLPMVICLLVTGLFCYVPIKQLVVRNQLYVGGDTGFWQDTIASLVEYSLYGHATARSVLIIQVIMALCALVFVVIAVPLALKQQADDTTIIGLLALGTVLFIAITSTVQHVLLGSKFLQERYALFLLPLLLISIISLFHLLTRYSNNVAKAGVVIFAAIGGVALANTLFNANVRYALDWKYDSDTPAMLADLKNVYDAEHRSGSIILGVTWYHEPVVNFYRTTQKLDWLGYVERYGLNESCDFYYTDRADSADIKNSKILQRYDFVGTTLFEHSK